MMPGRTCFFGRFSFGCSYKALGVLFFFGGVYWSNNSNETRRRRSVEKCFVKVYSFEGMVCGAPIYRWCDVGTGKYPRPVD